MWYSKYAKLNEETELKAENKALIAGGTQGIGAGIALRFALAGATVWIIGRSEQRGKELVEKLSQATQEGLRRRKKLDQESSERDHLFFQADLSTIAGIKKLSNEIINKSKKNSIDWFIETQGGPPTGNTPDTTDGIDSHFALQCLSRYALAKNFLSKGLIKQGVCIVAAPGQGGKKPLDLNDFECKATRASFGRNMPRTGANDSAILDATIETFAQKYPNLHFTHLFPVVVGTNTAANAGFPFPLPQLFAFASYFIPSANQFAEWPFYLHTHSESKKTLLKGKANLFDPLFGKKDLSINVQDEKHRKDIIDKLDSYGV